MKKYLFIILFLIIPSISFALEMTLADIQQKIRDTQIFDLTTYQQQKLSKDFETWFKDNYKDLWITGTGKVEDVAGSTRKRCRDPQVDTCSAKDMVDIPYVYIIVQVRGAHTVSLELVSEMNEKALALKKGSTITFKSKMKAKVPRDTQGLYLVDTTIEEVTPPKTKLKIEHKKD